MRSVPLSCHVHSLPGHQHRLIIRLRNAARELHLYSEGVSCRRVQPPHTEGCASGLGTLQDKHWCDLGSELDRVPAARSNVQVVSESKYDTLTLVNHLRALQVAKKA